MVFSAKPDSDKKTLNCHLKAPRPEFNHHLTLPKAAEMVFKTNQTKTS